MNKALLPMRPPGVYQECPLPPCLDRHRIEALWRYDATSTGPQLILPDGRMDLVAHAIVTTSSRLGAVKLALAGPADMPMSFMARPHVVSIGIRFQIGWGGVCMGVRPVSLRNRWLGSEDLATLLGPTVRAVLHAQSLHALQHGLAQLVSSLSAKAVVPRGHGRAIDALRRPQASSRTQRRDMLDATGLPLRVLSGILRFQKAMALLQDGMLPLVDVAATAGYADQAHMTREFRRFGGFTPAQRGLAPLVGDLA